VVQTTGNRTIKEASPGGGVGLKITFVKFYAAAPQQFQILLAKCARAMMLRLLSLL
jgi:hypothetical protein